jgi:hypothetical protein
MKHFATVLCLASLAVLASCAATMPIEEFDRHFPPSAMPTAERMPQEDEGDTEAARTAAAQRYFEAVDLEQLLAGAMHEEAKTLPASEREAFLRIAHKAFSTESFRSRMLDLAVKHYSRAQLVALTQFVETREGRSAWRKSAHRSGPPEPSEGSGDTAEDRRVAVQRHLVVLDFRQFYGTVVRGTVAAVPGSERERFLGRMAGEYEATRRDYADQLTQYFTRREIDALTRFYGSAIGQAILVRTALFMGDGLPFIMERVRQAAGQ